MVSRWIPVCKTKAAAQAVAPETHEVDLDETTDRIVFALEGNGDAVTLMYSGMGGPAVANALEMAKANGAERVVIFGACGGVAPEIYDACKGLVIGVESECAAAAVVSASIGLEIGAILFCTDNVTRDDKEKQRYKGLKSPQVQRGFERGLNIAMPVLGK